MRQSLAALAPLALGSLALAACSPSADEAPAADSTATPTAVATETTAAATPTRDEDIKHYLLQEFPEAAPMQYAAAWTDLNGDGMDEAIVYLVTPYFCGTGGCNTLVLTPAGPMYEKVGDISVSRTPITVMDTSTNGWKDLTVAISGGGGKADVALLKFDGKAYPGNPTVPPAQMVPAGGKEVIGEEPALIKVEATPVPPSGE